MSWAGLIGPRRCSSPALITPWGKGGEPERYVTVVGSYGRVSDQVPAGYRLKLVPGMVQRAALWNGRLVEINSERLAKGLYGAWVGRVGMRAGVATPIVVGGRHWGVMVAATSEEDFPAGHRVAYGGFHGAGRNGDHQGRGRAEICANWPSTQAYLCRMAMLVVRGELLNGGVGGRGEGGSAALRQRHRQDDQSLSSTGRRCWWPNEGTTGLDVRIGERWEGLSANCAHCDRAANWAGRTGRRATMTSGRGALSRRGAAVCGRDAGRR